MLASLGFSLDEVKEILSEENLKELSQRKLGELDKKCEDLQSEKKFIEYSSDNWRVTLLFRRCNR